MEKYLKYWEKKREETLCEDFCHGPQFLYLNILK